VLRAAARARIVGVLPATAPVNVPSVAGCARATAVRQRTSWRVTVRT
jgi:hypothetical protein